MDNSGMIVLMFLPAEQQYVFARLHAIWTLPCCDKLWKLALVTFFKTIKTPEQSIIGQRLVREDRDSGFIQLEWIKRRAYMSSCFERGFEDDYYITDTINDSDMYLRLQNLNSCI